MCIMAALDTFFAFNIFDNDQIALFNILWSISTSVVLAFIGSDVPQVFKLLYPFQLIFFSTHLKEYGFKFVGEHPHAKLFINKHLNQIMQETDLYLNVVEYMSMIKL